MLVEYFFFQEYLFLFLNILCSLAIVRLWVTFRVLLFLPEPALNEDLQQSSTVSSPTQTGPVMYMPSAAGDSVPVSPSSPHAPDLSNVCSTVGKPCPYFLNLGFSESLYLFLPSREILSIQKPKGYGVFLLDLSSTLYRGISLFGTYHSVASVLSSHLKNF